MRIIYGLLILWAGLLLASFASNRGTLHLYVKNVETDTGLLHVAIYKDATDFLQEDADEVIGKILPVSSKPNCTVTIPELPFGEYAIAIFHDLNNNGKLDRNPLGIPTEPYAFSNNPAIKWRSPTFAETRIEFGESQKKIILELKRWRKH